MKQLDYVKLLETDWADQFDGFQLVEIRKGVWHGLDVSLYADPKFEVDQMREIRLGLVDGLDASIYANPEFDVDQMAEIRRGLGAGLDVTIYAKPEYEFMRMYQIRMGLLEGVNVRVYAKPEFDDMQMHHIREGMNEGLDVRVYAKPEFNDMQMYQIREGLKGGLDVSHFAKPEMSREPMRRARHELMADTHKNITVAIFGKNAGKFQWFPEPESDIKRKYAGRKLDKVIPVRLDGEWLVPKEMVVDVMLVHDQVRGNRMPNESTPEFEAIDKLVERSVTEGLVAELSDLGAEIGK